MLTAGHQPVQVKSERSSVFRGAAKPPRSFDGGEVSDRVYFSDDGCIEVSAKVRGGL
jgi:hypothetical protein